MQIVRSKATYAEFEVHRDERSSFLLLASPAVEVPLLLLGQSADWRRESRVTVTGFAVLWVLAEISRELLGQRRGDLQVFTLDHIAQALGSTQWWYCAWLLTAMSVAALWASCAADGSFGEAVQRFKRC